MAGVDDLRGRHRGETCTVLGCGPSLDGWRPTGGAVIACNRAMMRRPGANYGVCIEAEDDPIWSEIDLENVGTLIAQHARNPETVVVQVRDVREWFPGCPGRRMRTRMSPFWAAGLALVMGFNLIRIVGVDMTPDRYDSVRTAKANRAWQNLAGLARWCGSELVNIAPPDVSRLALPHAPEASWTYPPTVS